MAFELANFQDSQLNTDYLIYLVEQQAADSAARYSRLWNYFRNPLIPATGPTANALNSNSRPYYQAQECGIPARITGIQRTASTERATDLQRKEVVIENDIAWRIGTMIDFLFGKPVSIRSLSTDSDLALAIEKVITAIFDANGGVSFLQEMGLFGSVYGFADIALRTPADGKAPPALTSLRPVMPSAAADFSTVTDPRPGSIDDASDDSSVSADGKKDPRRRESRINIARAVAAARSLQLETVEAPRVLPILDEDDYRTTRYWVQKFYKYPSRMSGSKRFWFQLPWTSRQDLSPAVLEVIEILGPTWWQRYENRQLVAEGPNMLGRLPIVHIQNIALPGSYEGLSDVEPLIPLQDELNTRLSDRAHRVTYEAFKMYLGKGIDDFLERPVGPGQMWATENLNASIEEFGTDKGSPSEDAHIEQNRQAMDKVSGVTPLAAGLISGNIGNLTSATALKVLLSGLLAKTNKKRLSYGAGLQRLIELSLGWLNKTGAFYTSPEDRRVEIHWPNPLPNDEGEQLRNALMKAQLSVPTDRILAELGYDRQTVASDRD